MLKTGNKQLYKLILKRRTVRLFRQREVPLSIVKKVINSARLAPSAANLQFLEYLVIQDKDLRAKVFPTLRWAGYVAPDRNPPPERMPTLYILILINKERTKEPNARDIGAACENILLSLLVFGLGGCWLQNIDKGALSAIVHLPKRYELDSLIAAGYPAEFPKLETDSENIKYWLDDKNRLHVPKRPLDDVFHYNYL